MRRCTRSVQFHAYIIGNEKSVMVATKVFVCEGAGISRSADTVSCCVDHDHQHTEIVELQLRLLRFVTFIITG
jgi:hypothetical protein